MKKQKQKESVQKLITNVNPIDHTEEIDVEIKIPQIIKGKSADVVNSALFLKKSITNPLGKTLSEENEPIKKTMSIDMMSQESTEKPVLKQGTRAHINFLKKKGKDRDTLFRQMQDQIRKRRSKFISNEEIQGSFKSTKL